MLCLVQKLLVDAFFGSRGRHTVSYPVLFFRKQLVSYNVLFLKSDTVVAETE